MDRRATLIRPRPTRRPLLTTAAAGRRASIWGAGIGLGLWGVGLLGLLPRHRAAHGDGWQITGAAQATNLTAHLLFGLAVALAAQEVWAGRPMDTPRVG